MQNSRTPLDEIDSRLLGALQRNAHLTAQELSDALNLSPSQIGRRRQRLEKAGIIAGYCARVAPIEVGLNVQGFIQVQMVSHEPARAKAFAQLVSTRAEITSAWTMTGEADYLLRVFCNDLPALNRLIHDVLLPHPSVARVQSQIVMDQFKPDAPLPT